MTKKELKKFLLIYPKIAQAVTEKMKCCVFTLYGRKKRVSIPEWSYKITQIFKIIEAENNSIVKTIIEKIYIKGKNDKELIQTLPVTESSYYRIKRKIEDKIYQLYILFGYVTESEISSNRIIE